MPVGLFMFRISCSFGLPVSALVLRRSDF